jgi:hypothetical protein
MPPCCRAWRVDGGTVCYEASLFGHFILWSSLYAALSVLTATPRRAEVDIRFRMRMNFCPLTQSTSRHWQARVDTAQFTVLGSIIDALALATLYMEEKSVAREGLMGIVESSCWGCCADPLIVPASCPRNTPPQPPPVPRYAWDRQQDIEDANDCNHVNLRLKDPLRLLSLRLAHRTALPGCLFRPAAPAPT